MLDKKNRQFLAKPAEAWYRFQKAGQGRLALPMSDARIRVSASRRGNGSEMGFQAIEIA
jgi:hypothetical protein